MKTHVKRPLLIIVFTVFFLSFLLLLFYFIQVINEKTALQNSASQSQIVSKVTLGLPVRLIIPVINVNAKIQYLGVTSNGEMEIPSNATDVGWFKLGPRPGERGSAVIAGHFDGENGEAGVFTNLNKLKKGDKLYIKDANGKTISFVVQENRIYDPGYANDVFSGSSSAYLNLITCDGVWDGAKKSYSKRLVVFADIVR
jgi:LPXTG-site transpeptidase (sortase) family protein